MTFFPLAKLPRHLIFFFFSIYTMVRAKNAHRREIMKLAEQIISLTLAALMVLTGVPVRAADVSANKMQNAVQEQIEQALEADFEAAGSIYGPTFPTLKQQIEQMTAAVNKMKEKAPSFIEKFKKVIEEVSKLSDKDKEALKKELQTLKNDTDQYVAKNPAALAKYAKGDKEQLALAFQTVTYDKMKQMQVQAGIGDGIHDFKEEVFSEKTNKVLRDIGSFFGMLATFSFPPALLAVILDSGEVGAWVWFGSSVLLILVALVLSASAPATVFFSPEAGKMDCGTLKHKRPCRPINPEKAKAEFLNNPFKAVELFAANDGRESAVLYLADEEGANMLRNTVNILSYAPIYDVEDPVSQKYIQKMAYVNTMHWKKLSKQDKIKYLFELSMQVLVDPDVRTRQ